MFSKGYSTYSANKGRDECNTGFGACNSLREAEEEGQVAMNAVLLLEFACGLYSFPCGCDFNEDTILVEAHGLVQGNELLGLERRRSAGKCTHVWRPSTLAFVRCLSNERRASTSVETRPGMIANISLPNSTSCHHRSWDSVRCSQKMSINCDAPVCPLQRSPAHRCSRPFLCRTRQRHQSDVHIQACWLRLE